MKGHRFDPTILREYDIRGIVGRTLFADDARALGRVLATVCERRGLKRLAVGYDGRLSSPELEAALVEGLTAGGIDVLRIGRGPTPMLYFAAYTQPVDGGVMVTGSHNPPDYNGFKITLEQHSFFGAAIRELGELAAAGVFSSGRGKVETVDLRAAYVQRLARDAKGARAFRIGWDPGNGAAAEVLQQLAKLLPGEHHLINDTIDGTFPAHHPDPTVEKNLAQLKALVAEQRLDFGVAFDGDGDRIGLIDEQGRVLWGDQMMLLLARPILARQPGATIIADVKASRVLFDGVTAMGGRPLMWKTGHSHIKAKLKETGAPFAGEMSAHLFFAEGYYGYDDALYAAVRVIDALSREGCSLGAFRDSLPAVVNTPEIRFPCPEEKKRPAIEAVVARLKRAGASFVDIDGVRVTTPEGWWLLRASNTQDVLVARCEAADEAGLARLKATLAETIKAAGLPVPAF
ncbi:MAG TPA: phosphomannomutase/phosphoglucomutase [Kiloniellales bacterium]|nr:phosphomannomutase/phosphoglucomutase [Kiloniellales bacterium]